MFGLLGVDRGDHGPFNLVHNPMGLRQGFAASAGERGAQNAAMGRIGCARGRSSRSRFARIPCIVCGSQRPRAPGWRSNAGVGFDRGEHGDCGAVSLRGRSASSMRMRSACCARLMAYSKRLAIGSGMPLFDSIRHVIY